MGDHHTGSCLCGKVSYRVEGPLREVLACHCTQCRKQSGHHFAATNAEDKALSVSGDEYIKWYRASDSAKRGFCSNCGSVLFWKHDDHDYTSILAGSFDKPTDLKMGKHIFVADKGDYYEIADDVPQYLDGGTILKA
ncbi:MAG: GFA family protein [Salaquimonas sp.]